jgi:hypothetical protein
MFPPAEGEESSEDAVCGWSASYCLGTIPTDAPVRTMVLIPNARLTPRGPTTIQSRHPFQMLEARLLASLLGHHNIRSQLSLLPLGSALKVFVNSLAKST